MKLITEQIFNTKYLVEENNGKKEYFLEGVFMQAEIKNRNGRVYKESVLRPAVERYIQSQIRTNRAVGELNHPCFKANTEVFVVGKGWIKIPEVRIGDVVYTLNLNSGQIEQQPV